MDGQDPSLLTHLELRVLTSRPQEMQGVGGCWIVASLNWTGWNTSAHSMAGGKFGRWGVARGGGINGGLVHACSSF